MNIRALWWIALAFTLMWIWMEWVKFTAPKPPQAETTQQNLPAVEAVQQASQLAQEGAADTPVAQKAVASAQRVRVKTDVLDIELDTLGGDIRVARLLKFAASAEEKDKPFTLLSDTGPLFHIIQNGLTSPVEGQPAPTHKVRWHTPKTEYALKGENLVVPFTWEQGGVKVTKTYTFEPGSYVVKVTYQVENRSGQVWQGALYSQIQRNRYVPNASKLIWTYTGPVFYDPENKYQKVDFDELLAQPISAKAVQGGWTAMIQHYFLSAIIPPQDQQNIYFGKPLAQDRFAVGVVSPVTKIADGQQASFQHRYFIGPAIEELLEPLAEGLELTKDYGVLTFIAEPLFWVLKAIYSLVGNWGWAIIILTVLIKLAFYKLSETSYRSMAKLKQFHPKLQQLKENYGDDKQLFQQKLMQLYREEKINPMGGCLPILVQMPVFIALYWVLLYSVEIRQAPWILWIDDLSAPDPYYVLPLIMGASMWVQMKLNPTTMMDETQQKVMQLMPIIFTIFFLWFPSGLVLYWVVNNILSIAQQWYITRKIEQEG